MKPKRYKLKKDLPTFKAGDEFELMPCGALVQIINGQTGVCAYAASTLEKFPSILTDWFEEIKPAEPLIKDEKIRKAVRAWAEVNSIKEAMYAERPDRSLCLLVDMGDDDYNIDFVGWIPTLKDSKTYTIAELCGEEEE